MNFNSPKILDSKTILTRIKYGDTTEELCLRYGYNSAEEFHTGMAKTFKGKSLDYMLRQLKSNDKKRNSRRASITVPKFDATTVENGENDSITFTEEYIKLMEDEIASLEMAHKEECAKRLNCRKKVKKILTEMSALQERYSELLQQASDYIAQHDEAKGMMDLINEDIAKYRQEIKSVRKNENRVALIQ